MDKSLILKEIKKYYNFKTDGEFADFLGIKQNTLSNWASRNSIDYDRIITKCEEIDANWLLTGKGSMLKDPVNNIFKNDNIFKTKEEQKRELFNSFGDISSGDERLQATVAKLERVNEMLTKENLLQEKVIQGLEFKIATLEKNLSEPKYKEKEAFLYKNVAEPAPELTSKK